MKKKMMALALWCGACAVAQAGDFYVAGDIGLSRLKGIGGSDQGFSLGGGYQFNKTWAAEMNYRFLGSETGDFIWTDGSKQSVSYRIRALQASGLGYWPLSDQLSVYGRLGLNAIQEKYSYSDPKANNFLKSSNGGLLLGLGLNYALSPQVSIRAEYQLPASNLYVLSTGVKYTF